MPAPVAFDDDLGLDANSEFGCLHYVPPSAISNKYYALQDPNVYLSDETQTSYFWPPAAPIATADPSPCFPMTIEPSTGIEPEEPPVSPFTLPVGSRTPSMGSLTPPMASITPPSALCTSRFTHTPIKRASFGISCTSTFGHLGKHSTLASALVPVPLPPACQVPTCHGLRLHQRNGDDPGGDIRLVTHRSAQL